MSRETAQQRALKEYRARLRDRGLVRFEVLGLDSDRELLRSLAKRLAEEDPRSGQLREIVRRAVAGEAPAKGGIFDTLRRSPLVGVDLEIDRPVLPCRKIEL